MPTQCSLLFAGAEFLEEKKLSLFQKPTVGRVRLPPNPDFLHVFEGSRGLSPSRKRCSPRTSTVGHLQKLGAKSRSNCPELERRDFHLFIDEFQNFSTDAFASILAEARKYRLCLTLSHQYIDQLPLPIRQAVFGNVGTLIAFRVGYTDAEIMEKEFGMTYPASALADLDRYEAVVKLLEDGTNREPFRARMLPPLENRVGRKDKLIARSRERFAVPRAIVDGKMKRWMSSVTDASQANS